jgi:hypothetical protein
MHGHELLTDHVPLKLPERMIALVCDSVPDVVRALQGVAINRRNVSERSAAGQKCLGSGDRVIEGQPVCVASTSGNKSPRHDVRPHLD